jgi:thioredoxin-related protein
MFKKVILLLLLTGASLFAAKVEWANDFRDGIQKAQAQNKPVLFIFSRHTCKYCVILEETTLSDQRVVKALNKDFVSIISYSDDNDYTPKELWRPGTPTIWFLRPSGEPMFQPLMGAVGPDNFLKALAIVKGEFDKSQK